MHLRISTQNSFSSRFCKNYKIKIYTKNNFFLHTKKAINLEIKCRDRGIKNGNEIRGKLCKLRNGLNSRLTMCK